jgi:DNA repair protein RecN (Recombination protein N)
MLTCLRIADFAILEAAELPLGPGLTAITGETGAGKSILLDALALVLGGRTSDKVVRHGREFCEVEALFDDVVDPLVLSLLADLGVPLDDQGSLVLRRNVGKGAGKNRCWLNGRLVTAQQLKQVAAPLVDLSAQHAQHRLLEPAAHLELLDRFAGQTAMRQEVEAAYTQYKATGNELDQLLARQKQLADRMDYLRFVHKELAELGPKPGELAEIHERIRKLKASAQLLQAGDEVTALLEGNGGISEQAARATRVLGRHAATDDKLASLADRAKEIEVLAGDLAFDVGTWLRSLPRDDRELGRLSERQDQLLRAIKKHGGSEEALIAKLQQFSAELDQDTTELRIGELERQQKQEFARLMALSEELAERRKLAAVPLGEKIAVVVRQLGMPSARVSVELTRKETPGATGLDEAELHLCANLGEAGGPLRQVASGGELSRILLAVQRALGDAAWSQAQLAGGGIHLPTAIYDEADAGLSGTTGMVLGRFLGEIGARQQVLCISHLPQVAAAADCHVQVVKRESAGRTRSELQILDQEGRLAELARMLGSVEGEGDTALAHAAKMLGAQRRR